MSAVSRFVIKQPDFVLDAPSDVICTQIFILLPVPARVNYV